MSLRLPDVHDALVDGLVAALGALPDPGEVFDFDPGKGYVGGGCAWVDEEEAEYEVAGRGAGPWNIREVDVITLRFSAYAEDAITVRATRAARDRINEMASAMLVWIQLNPNLGVIANGMVPQSGKWENFPGESGAVAETTLVVRVTVAPTT